MARIQLHAFGLLQLPFASALAFLLVSLFSDSMQSQTPRPSGAPPLSLLEAEPGPESTDEVRFDAEPSTSLYCPICQDLFTKPVITPYARDSRF